MISNNQISDVGFAAIFGALFYCNHLEKLILNFEFIFLFYNDFLGVIV